MPNATQTYANHTHRPTLTNVGGLLALIAFVLFVINLFTDSPLLVKVGLLCLGASVMSLISISRVYTVKLQDRIIRLEMQLRLARVGANAAAERLTTKQLVALRFASDAELAGLAQRAASEMLTPDQIKRSVTDWQPDLMRT